eukprot:3200999-Prymnesium_polylepis.1
MAAALHSADPSAALPAPAEPDDASVCAAAAALVQAGCKHVLVTRGARGLLWAHSGADGVQMEEMPALPATVATTRGAGDAFVTGTAWGLLQRARDAAREPD